MMPSTMTTTTRCPTLQAEYVRVVVKKIDISGYVTQRLCKVDRMRFSIWMELSASVIVCVVGVCVCSGSVCVCVDGVP